MKFPLSWLRDYIDLELSPNAIAKTLTMQGIEVDSIENDTPSFTQVVVAKVLEVQKHPNADKLCIATVFDGTQNYTVVCGASNCRPGIKTALALVGAVLPEGEGKTFKVKVSKIRGVESFGMLCAPEELGLSKTIDGIIEFADHLKEGVDLNKMYSEVVFEVSLTPNLGHCGCLLGIAKELSAATHSQVILPAFELAEQAPHSTLSQISVTVEEPELCQRYACRIIEGLKIAPSPEWLQKRLTLSGIRPINNVVDITNYVFLEMGQPLHAFDYSRLKGQQIHVRLAKAGEKIVTIDNKERELDPSMLVICDEHNPVAVAGVMGGLHSEVIDNTTTVVLESASFSPTSIRKTSKKLVLSTDASRRFERNADPNKVPVALDRAAALMVEIAGGQVCKGMIDVKTREFIQKAIDCRLTRINKVLGTHIGVGEVETIFHSLGFHSRWDGKDLFHVRIPTDRADINTEIDLIEEVARLYGFDNIPQPPASYHTSQLPNAPIFLFEREVRNLLVSQGLQEFITCDLIGPKLLAIVKEDPSPTSAMVKVLNPTSVEQSILRESLLPGLLEVVKYNFDHENSDLQGFELGRVHFKSEGHYKEQSVAGIVLMGNEAPPYFDPKSRPVDFYDLKGILDNIFKGIGVSGLKFEASTLDIFHPGRQATISANGIRIGALGEIHPDVQRRLDIPQRILFAEINLHDIYPLKNPDQRMQAMPMYPCTTRDWTLTMDEQVSIQKLFEFMQSQKSPLLEEVSLLDIYRNEKLGPTKKNVTLHFVYRDKEKTLSQESADAEHLRLTAAAAHHLGITITGL